MAIALTQTDGFHHLINHFRGIAAQGCRGNVRLEMPTEHNIASTLERTLYRFDLPQHVHTVNVRILEHSLDTLQMSFGDGKAPNRSFARLERHT